LLSTYPPLTLSGNQETLEERFSNIRPIRPELADNSKSSGIIEAVLPA
jgi:hypothetical protein